ncbi:DUF411 domain-containing protein [Rhizobiales bacterium RZME27]|jgi:hypothetical protein|uniref:DUF411 domain-containing protein n=1 Tax=Endobacterium cereale TaxID=2663029 RepID=A0A6A8AIH0_9HYPH|nr:DUF411 domain-containing protein [Endobacterium cereale]MEB2843890.1 DUF411 domain-containing protein [Endobacterium cereale]MQY49500.1 DUF411 domain-containing protein [Endobacterium cereale]
MKPRSMIGALALALMTAVSAQAVEMVVYKEPYCGCCEEWAKAIQAAGVPLRMQAVDDMDAVKAKWGVPEYAWSCHTAVADGYVFEGHVPLEAVQRVLRERPDIVGVAVPGMPAGSLGMGDDPAASYDIVVIGKDGRQSVYMEVRP